jgi:hypothetical protein
VPVLLPGQWAPAARRVPIRGRVTWCWGAFPSAVPCARMHARQIVWEWGLAALAEPVELVVSELITNAVRACEGLGARSLTC